MNQAIEKQMPVLDAQRDRPRAPWFTFSAGSILIVTGVAKAWAALRDAQFFTVLDPVLGIPSRHLMLITGLAEIIIAVVCLLNKRQTLATALVAWLTTNFVVYRLGLWWMGWHKPCGCMGGLADLLHISPTVADNIMKVVLAYLLIGSYGLLFWGWWRRKQVNGCE